jgi:hypothetical protein
MHELQREAADGQDRSSVVRLRRTSDGGFEEID